MAPGVPGWRHVILRRLEHWSRDDSTGVRLQRRAARARSITAGPNASLTFVCVQVNFYSAYVTTMLLPLGALALCGTMWCAHSDLTLLPACV